jgi:hypothetical protein
MDYISLNKPIPIYLDKIKSIFFKKRNCMTTKGKTMKKIIYFIVIASLACATVSAQHPNIEVQLRQHFENQTLTLDNPLLTATRTDPSNIASARNYYRAMLTIDIERFKELHSENFRDYSFEFYGQQSAIQLVMIDFINREYESAWNKLAEVNTARIPNALYWKAKISQAQNDFTRAIEIIYNFMYIHPEHDLTPIFWVMLLEINSSQYNLTDFEHNLINFRENPRFSEFNAYISYLHGKLVENTNLNLAREIYNNIITEFPSSQYRILAEDRLVAIRTLNQQEHQVDEVAPERPLPAVTARRVDELPSGTVFLQFGAFSTDVAARNFSTELNNQNIQTFPVFRGSDNRFLVILGPFLAENEAQRQRNLLENRHQTILLRIP